MQDTQDKPPAGWCRSCFQVFLPSQQRPLQSNQNLLDQAKSLMVDWSLMVGLPHIGQPCPREYGVSVSQCNLSSWRVTRSECYNNGPSGFWDETALELTTVSPFWTDQNRTIAIQWPPSSWHCVDRALFGRCFSLHDRLFLCICRT